MGEYYSGLQAFLRQQLATVTGLPAVAYEGRRFTPTIGVPWVAEYVVPEDAPLVSYGARSGFVREDFFYYIEVYSPSGEGFRLTDHNDLVDRIRDVFSHGSNVRNLGSTFFGAIEKVARRPNIYEEDWVRTTVEVRGYFHRIYQSNIA